MIWEQHPESSRHRREVFQSFFAEALRSGGALAVETRDGAMIGSSRFHGFDAEHSAIEIGWTFLARSHWGGVTNRELKSLMLAHAFRFVERVEFHVGTGNRRSQRALIKLGARQAGVRRDSSGREDVVFEIRREDWARS